MKAKILSELKTKYANLGFGDKAFDGVADYLSKTVTKEEDIETAISGVEPLLKAFQGDTDKVRTDLSALKRERDELKREKAEWEKSNPKKEEKKDVPDDIDAKLQKLIAEHVKPLQDKLDAHDAKEAATKREAKILAKAQELQIPQFRIDEGFNIAQDADDNTVNEYLSKVKQNLVTAGLEKKPSGQGLATSDDIAKQEAEEWAKTLKDSKNKVSF